jgi:hypothetical protein
LDNLSIGTRSIIVTFRVAKYGWKSVPFPHCIGKNCKRLVRRRCLGIPLVVRVLVEVTVTDEDSVFSVDLRGGTFAWSDEGWNHGSNVADFPILDSDLGDSVSEVDDFVLRPMVLEETS